MGLKEMFCKHHIYTITKSRVEDRTYACKCNKCGYQWTKRKAIGESYEVGTVVHQ